MKCNKTQCTEFCRPQSIKTRTATTRQPTTRTEQPNHQAEKSNRPRNHPQTVKSMDKRNRPRNHPRADKIKFDLKYLKLLVLSPNTDIYKYLYLNHLLKMKLFVCAKFAQNNTTHLSNSEFSLILNLYP